MIIFLLCCTATPLENRLLGFCTSFPWGGHDVSTRYTNPWCFQEGKQSVLANPQQAWPTHSRLLTLEANPQPKTSEILPPGSVPPPKFNSSPLKKGGLEDDPFLLGFGNFSGAMLVVGSVTVRP